MWVFDSQILHLDLLVDILSSRAVELWSKVYDNGSKDRFATPYNYCMFSKHNVLPEYDIISSLR